MNTITATWECVNGHTNSEEVECFHDPAMIIEASYYPEEVSMELQCTTCGELGTDDGVRVTSTDEYINGALVLLDYQQYGA